MDETEVFTVLKPNKILHNVDEKRGSNVTMVTAIFASENTVPPMFVFPRIQPLDVSVSGPFKKY